MQPATESRQFARLLSLAQDLADESTAQGAQDIDAADWLGRWLETPHAALEGRRPAELLDTPAGFKAVSRLLGAMQSGAYQ